MYIIDRRKNPSGKSLVNTQRFMHRAKAQIRDAVNSLMKTGKIKDINDGDSKISVVSSSAISEPSFRFRSDNSVNVVLPGNKDTSAKMISHYVVNDKIEKPSSNSGNGKGRDGSPDGSGKDDFTFVISSEEFLNILFDDLELPNQEEKMKSTTEKVSWNKMGYKTDGSPANLSGRKTMHNSFSRRIALNRPKKEELLELENKLFDPSTPEEDRPFLKMQLDEMYKKMRRISYIDPIDVRYHNLMPQPRPIFNAVMFCMMDVSGSMTEHMKDLAKRFYILLYRFLKTKYNKIQVEFIRHTHEASFCDEQTFFYDPSNGGTLISPALKMIKEKCDAKYPTKDFNIYIAQCSDGDNTVADNTIVENILTKDILPISSYYFYLETGRDSDYPVGFSKRNSDIWSMYEGIQLQNSKKFAMNKITRRDDVYSVFRKFMSEKK